VNVRELSLVHTVSDLVYEVVGLISRSIFIGNIRPMACLPFLCLVYVTYVCPCFRFFSK
jgi:hypothetical protein